MSPESDDAGDGSEAAVVDTGSRALVFSDRRQAGAYAVTDTSGGVLGLIRPGRGGRFVAEDPTGAVLCAAWSGRWGKANLWRATGPDNAPILELRKHWFRPTAEVRLYHDGKLTVEGSAWRRNFLVRNEHTVVLSATPQTSALSLRPYEYAVDASEELTLAEVVAVVQIWRTLRKRDDATATAAATTAVISST